MRLLRSGDSSPAPLVSKTESLEVSALESFRAMAKQITDGEVTLNIVQYLFNILNGLSCWPSRSTIDPSLLIGSESSVSKLSVISQRENVLSAIGALSRSSSANLSQDGILKMLEKSFYSIIQQEVHEGLIGHMLQQMSGWSARLTSVNPTVTEFFKVNTNRCQERSKTWRDCLFSSTERSGTENGHSDHTNCVSAVHAGDVQRFVLTEVSDPATIDFLSCRG